MNRRSSMRWASICKPPRYVQRTHTYTHAHILTRAHTHTHRTPSCRHPSRRRHSRRSVWVACPHVRAQPQAQRHPHRSRLSPRKQRCPSLNRRSPMRRRHSRSVWVACPHVRAQPQGPPHRTPCFPRKRRPSPKPRRCPSPNRRSPMRRRHSRSASVACPHVRAQPHAHHWRPPSMKRRSSMRWASICKLPRYVQPHTYTPAHTPGHTLAHTHTHTHTQDSKMPAVESSATQQECVGSPRVHTKRGPSPSEEADVEVEVEVDFGDKAEGAAEEGGRRCVCACACGCGDACAMEGLLRSQSLVSFVSAYTQVLLRTYTRVHTTAPHTRVHAKADMHVHTQV